jgi:3-methyladenine DNA glycosylase/8-oxoguanine DNA glycosylase
MPSQALTAGARELAKRDRVVKRLIAEHGLPDLGGRRVGRTRFEQLAEAICYQQLAGAAAEAIWLRVRLLVDGSFTPEAVLGVGYDALRGAGFSNAKALSLLDLAAKVAAGEVRLDRIGRLSDEAVVAELTPVRGIGPWTAEMFLIFTLKRLDVWPVGDYGVRAGYAVAYDLPTMPSSQELVPLGDRFRPYRTMVAWYCWQALIASRAVASSKCPL